MLVPMSDLADFIYYVHPARGEKFINNPTDAESVAVGEHFGYLKQLTAEGTVLLAGPSTDPPYTGIVIFRAKDRAAAEALMRADPAVAAGVFEARLSEMVLSLVGDIQRRQAG